MFIRACFKFERKKSTSKVERKALNAFVKELNKFLIYDEVSSKTIKSLTSGWRTVIFNTTTSNLSNLKNLLAKTPQGIKAHLIELPEEKFASMDFTQKGFQQTLNDLLE